jgi:hypothetical protein
MRMLALTEGNPKGPKQERVPTLAQTETAKPVRNNFRASCMEEDFPKTRGILM